MPGENKADMSVVEEKKEVYLEADKEIPGQHYCCLSFISPNKVLKDKNQFLFSEFLKDYELQYKIRATESFVMSQVNKLQDVLTRSQDALENLLLKGSEASVADISGVLLSFKETRAKLTLDVTNNMEAHIKSEMSDFRESVLQDAFETFLFKNKKKLEDAFFEKNEFRTTVQGIKVRGVYDTYNEAVARAKTLQKLDASFNVYVGQVGFWLPWDPEPHEVADQEYADDQLNTLMKKYKENEAMRDEMYAKEKSTRLDNVKVRGMTSDVAAGAGATTESLPSDMFAGEDLAIARKRDMER